jgi:hypothetical protein
VTEEEELVATQERWMRFREACECGYGPIPTLAYALVSAWCSSIEASLRFLCTEETVTITKREYEELLMLRTARRYPPVRHDLPHPSTEWFETNYPGNTA